MSDLSQIERNKQDIAKLVEVIRRLGDTIDLDTVEMLHDVGLTSVREYRLVAFNTHGQGVVCHKDTCREVFLRPNRNEAVVGQEVTEQEVESLVAAGAFTDVDMELSLPEIVEWLKRKMSER